MLRGAARLAGTEAINAFLDASHVQLASELTRFCGSHLLNRPHAETDDAARRDARTLVGLMGEAGWYRAIGTGDLRALCLTREQVAAASPLADAVLALQALGGTPLKLAGTDAQRSRWLEGILTGEIMTAFAMTEPDAGSDVASMKTTGRRDGAAWVLDGEKHLISNAGIADLYLVFAVTTPGAGSRGISVFLVPRDAKGLVFEGAQVLAAPHPLGRIRLDACRVPADALLGQQDAGFKLGMMTLDHVRPSVGAAACGMAARALVDALEYASTRHQFGAPIASFQLVREKIGRMATELEAARLLVFRAAWEKDHGEARITLEAAMAKSFATEAAQHVIDEAIQIGGGRGVLVGHVAERMYRAVRALRIYEGATEIQRLIVADALLGPLAPAPASARPAPAPDVG
jgi:alkylation response protein AidB-like acyl-CoA dehydrogenase